ncbi:hypothetical protein, partial [Roseovarius dicentrarchi]|uniref:hypothetical protein n=1 Tax=Roseovarius dicentrarchi TaxID=2250573 RepID=UPI00139666E4
MAAHQDAKSFRNIDLAIRIPLLDVYCRNYLRQSSCQQDAQKLLLRQVWLMVERVTARSLMDVGAITDSKPACLAWLKREGIISVKEGQKFTYPITDLPEPERLAYLSREIEAAHLTPGTYDDDAHASYLAASASLRAKAERRAAMVRLLKAVGSEVSWGDRLRLVRAKFGTEGTDKRTLQRYLNTVEGVDPINYAPALLPGHKGSPVRASTS